jgi:putative peptidoglycan lipid II flippase
MRAIMDSGAMRTLLDTAALRTLMDTTAMQVLRERYAGRGKMIAAVGLGFWIVLAVIAVSLALPGSSGPAARSANAASARAGAISAPASKGPARNQPTAPPRQRTTAPRTAVSAGQLLTVVRAEAFGPRGTSDGDNPQHAAFVLDGHGTPWQTNWYGTARFGSLKSGTGLVLDMGTPVTVAKVTLTLAAGSASVIVRVGNTLVPGTFTLMQERGGVGGTVTFQAAKPLHGRYIEIWFTTLPRDAAGTYQESVYNAKVTGQH